MDRLDLYKFFFTQESKYYTDKLVKFETDQKLSFNFWAGFFGVPWFIYRKMNAQAAIIFVIIFILTIIIAIIFTLLNPNDSSNGLYCIVITWVLSFCILGFIGNKLYITKSIKIVENFINKYSIQNIDNSVMNKIRQQGGTSISNALIYTGIMLLIQIILKIIIH